MIARVMEKKGTTRRLTHLLTLGWACVNDCLALAEAERGSTA